MPVNETAIVPDGRNRVKRLLAEAQDQSAEAKVTDPGSVKLVVRGMSQSLNLNDSRKAVILGRLDPGAAVIPDVDMTALGGTERGVSRKHARLEIKDNCVYLTDLDSSNGTFLRGERLAPYTPALVKKGDEVLLGRLAVEVDFD
jgi:pSer/pThr/pTyr-binding forkhead associated (FHA) protein